MYSCRKMGLSSIAWPFSFGFFIMPALWRSGENVMTSIEMQKSFSWLLLPYRKERMYSNVPT